ncbi:DsbA family protein [Patescibacteria group bacterium]|nr:DsbA family protein [Patescibacteria group bacterium]
MEPTQQTSSPLIPAAIIIGFGLIAGAIYFSGIGGGSAAPQLSGNTNVPTQVGTQSAIRAVDETDFIRGNPNAAIMVVEYSDYDCPFCKDFHETMNRIMDEYGVAGRVAWVYRQLPIAGLHPNAPKISEAALCVGELAGNEAFWNFSDLVFSERETNEPTNMTRLSEFATAAGADATAFTACLSSGKMKARVDASVKEGFDAGVTGTPHSVVLVGNQQAVIEGAQPYDAVRLIIDSLIGQLDGKPAVAPAQ